MADRLVCGYRPVGPVLPERPLEQPGLSALRPCAVSSDRCKKYIGAEIILLFGVGFLPQFLNITANVTVSFVCALQVQAFRKIKGSIYASIMCIGDIRSGAEAFCRCCVTRNRNDLRKFFSYLGIVLLFGAGACAEKRLSGSLA